MFSLIRGFIHRRDPSLVFQHHSGSYSLLMKGPRRRKVNLSSQLLAAIREAGVGALGHGVRVTGGLGLVFGLPLSLWLLSTRS